jgi:hypothetical protein
MSTDYILSAAGTTNPVLELTVSGISGALSIPTLQDVTINNAVDTFTWTQLNESSKLSVPTTATNSISTNLVVEEDTFFGSAAATSGSAAKLGLFGLSKAKTKVSFSINLGDKEFTGIGYITGLAPAVSADSPVWVTPVTISVSGDYTVA